MEGTRIQSQGDGCRGVRDPAELRPECWSLSPTGPGFSPLEGNAADIKIVPNQTRHPEGLSFCSPIICFRPDLKISNKAMTEAVLL